MDHIKTFQTNLNSNLFVVNLSNLDEVTIKFDFLQLTIKEFIVHSLAQFYMNNNKKLYYSLPSIQRNTSKGREYFSTSCSSKHILLILYQRVHTLDSYNSIQCTAMNAINAICV